MFVQKHELVGGFEMLEYQFTFAALYLLLAFNDIQLIRTTHYLRGKAHNLNDIVIDTV